MTLETVMFVLAKNGQIDVEFDEDPRDKLKLMNMIVKKGNAADRQRHERDVDSDEDGLDDREYMNN